MHYTVKAETEIHVPTMAEITAQNEIELHARLHSSGRMITLSAVMPRPAGHFRVYRSKDGDPKTEEMVAEGASLKSGDEMNIPVPPSDAENGALYTFRIEAELI